MSKLVDTARGMADVTRWPRTDKAASIGLLMWGLATATALASITLNILLGTYGVLFYVMCGVLVMDVAMLRLAAMGMGYRHALRGTALRWED